MDTPTNKTELLDTMRNGYAAFEAFLSPLDERQWTTPGVNGDWSIKDVLVHLTTWQERMARRLEGIARGEDMARFEPAITNEEEMNRFNDATFIANRARPLAEVQTAFRASFQHLLTAVEALDESVLFEKERFAWLKGEPLWTNVGGNSFWHYEEHTQTIEAWLAR